MKKKYITVLKKLCSIVTAVCFTFTVVGSDLYASVNFDTAKDQKRYFEKKDKNDFDSFFSDRYGKIVSYNDNLSSIVVINIQDLHCDYSVQKNIAVIIDEISKKYNIGDVYVEGGIDRIDTSFFANINPKYKQNILERLLKDGKLTGTEYYSAMNGKTKLLKGVEEKDVYLTNIARLNDIISLKERMSSALSNVNKEIDFLKSKYLKSKNKQFDKLLKQAEGKEISQEQFIVGLFNYAKQNNISLKNYENLKIYLSLFDSSIKNKKVQKELVEVLYVIKKSLSYDEYNQFIKLTSNFSDVRKMASFVKEFCVGNNINLSKIYPNLNEFFVLKEQYAKCNPIELVKEERKLVDVIRTYLSETDAELEVAYISDFEQFYSGYLSASLTAAQWEYVKLGLDKFKELYAKYSVSNDVEKLEKYSELLTQFYDVNTERNTIFVQKMGLSKNSVSNYSILQSSNLLSSAKKIVVLVAGGYHTDGINEILNKKGISNITITPNIADSTRDSRVQYEYLAQQQAMSVRQMIALGLISNSTTREQILTVVNSLLSNQNLDGVNINILVQQLNQLFSQNITVSLVQDGKQLEFDFKDGSKQVINIDEDVASVVEDQNKRDLSEGYLVRVTGDKLNNVIGLISKTTFNYGMGIFVPQIYQISKDVCLFMVENKWYLGNGAVWEIANSEYDGKTLDGVDPVVYEYMPEFMQKALESRQIGTDLVKGKKTTVKNKIMSKILALFLAVLMLVNLAGCSYNNRPTVEERPLYTATQVTEFVEESSKNIELFEDPTFRNRYLTYYVDAMSTEDKLDWHPYKPIGKTDEEILRMYSKQYDYISTLRNTYDQALVVVTYLKMGNTEKAREVLNEIYKFYQYDNKIYRSNKEYYEILGEIVWVGIAAVQYKLATGNDEFDELIEVVDNYLIERQASYSGFLYSSEAKNFSNGAYVSTEHMLDVVSYLNLKSLLPGNENNERERELLLKVAKYIRTQLIKNDSTIKRGKDDYSVALDTYSWGIQVFLALQKYNPDIYEKAGFDNLNYQFLLDNVENLTHVTEEQLVQSVSLEEYESMSGYHLYSWSNYVFYDEATNTYHTYVDEDLVEPRLNISFEWSLQMATAYYLMGDYETAKNIFDSATQLAKDLGFSDGLYPVSNLNYVYNYPDYGWLVARAPGITPTITAMLLELALGTDNPELASPHFPVVDRVDTTTPPSSILPTTLTKLNDLIFEGMFSIGKGLRVIINTETVESLFKPLNFISRHFQTTGAKILILVTSIMLFASFGIFISIIPLISTLLGSIAIALGANISTHVIIDYRYFKSIGLEEAIALHGKDNVRLTEKGLSINKNEQSIPIYVVNDKPKNVGNFKFRSVPIKVRAQNGKSVKCWIGNYNGLTVLFAEGASYDSIVKEFNKTRHFESVYGKRTALKTKVDVIEVDMNNPGSGLRYSDTGNIVVGSNIVETGGVVNLQKEISLLNNKKVEAVTINQNIAIYIDDAPEAISTSKDFVNTINLYVNSADLGVNAKILFTDEYINRIFELLEIEYGSKESAQKEFIKIIEQLKQENKEISIILKQSDINKIDAYKNYGIFSYIVDKGNYRCEYIDTVSDTKIKANFVTNLNQVRADGNLAIIKVSDFKKEISKTSGLFTFLNSSLNLKEILQKRNIEFIRQTASNFDFNQIPNIDIELIAQIIVSSENKFEQLSKYLNGSDSISMYYLGLSNDEQRAAFMDEILKRALVINYLRSFEQDNVYYGLKDKSLENILAKALVEKYKSQRTFEINSNANLNETTASEVEFELLKKISQLSQQAFEQNDPQSIDDIIKLIPLYAERNVELRTANINVVDIQNIKGILSAA